jgi:hypothetical protein
LIGSPPTIVFGAETAREQLKYRPNRPDRLRTEGTYIMVVVLALLIVLLAFGLGFTFHLLWILAGVLLVLWLIGFAIGRGENSGSRHFYNW